MAERATCALLFFTPPQERNMVLLSSRRWARLCPALLVAVVLLAGQRHAVLADGDAMDSSQVSVCFAGILVRTREVWCGERNERRSTPTRTLAWIPNACLAQLPPTRVCRC